MNHTPLYFRKIFLCLVVSCVFSALSAKTIVVDNQKAGANDANTGTFSQPLKTIQAAANLAQAGDTILVKAGIYREEVKPPLGGTKDKPITYLAAPGEDVSIRGSEQITGWIKEGNGLWLATIDNAMFVGFNPYTTNISGAWLYGSGTSDSTLKYHLGDVYCNGEAFYEVFSIPECEARVNSWSTGQENGKTLIRANFGTTNPNTDLTEINVRATAIFPEISGLKYIVIDGFDIRHTASQWSDIYKLEEGAIGMKYGYGWVIQNCTITNSRNNGISMGVTDEVFFSRTLTRGGDNIPPYGSFGFHIIRNNVIKRCGQCAIYGCYGAVGTLIENNEITETVYRNEWQGPNQADIKILFPIDVIIRHNKFYGPNGSGLAIWLDWGSQNARVTGNLIIDREAGVFTEVSFGPTVVDNNIFIRSGVRDWSDGNLYAHNLFYQSPMFHLMGEPNRPFVPYYKPHSTELAGRNETMLRHERWYNNIFIGGSARKIPQNVNNTSGFLVNNNVYLDSAYKFPFEGDKSIVDDLRSEFEFDNQSNFARLSFKLSKQIIEVTYPLISSMMIGEMPLPQVFMENPDGTPLDITTDYFGNETDPKKVMPGPFQKISAGANKFSVWPPTGLTAVTFAAGLSGTQSHTNAKDYHVSRSGLDSNDGSKTMPFRTISAAAAVAQPGDVITVHEGTYRERVNPPRGGLSDSKRIVYQAAEGESVVIKGSEVIKKWEKVENDTWTVTLPNTYFGDFNPYNDLIHGEWYATPEDGYDRHTGAVYLNEKWLSEASDLKTVLKPVAEMQFWYARVDDQTTTLWAQFKGVNPNNELVEINVRQSIFYPDQPGRNYITVRGFTLRQAATPWSGAMSEQIGLIGTHWSKGWVIEDNVISHSMNTGIALGRYDLGRYGMAMPAISAPGYIESIKLALEHGWSKENTGSHVVRNNHISHCEKNGIHGSLGGIFSTIEGNTICHISVEGWIDGTDMAGIKLLGSQDVLIKANRIVNCCRGIWLDWMAQGTRVTANLCYQNNLQDLYAEVNHGPYLIDNNMFLSLCSVWDMSQGGAYVHNLMAGKLNQSPHHRKTPFHLPHSTAIAGYQELLGGDYRFFNNLFVRGCQVNEGQSDPDYKRRLQYGAEDFGLSAFSDTELPSRAGGNVYLKGASAFENESNPLELAYDPDIRIEKTKEGLFLYMNMDKELIMMKNQVVTTELLGRATVSDQAYENPDKSPLTIDQDYLGKQRNKRNPVPGPFEITGKGLQKIKVWE